uniref:Uncharacterized protein n=1 Tax=Arundo donax TaxID=35708 RepID=A0A0A9HD17_ARUDO
MPQLCFAYQSHSQCYRGILVSIISSGQK